MIHLVALHTYVSSVLMSLAANIFDAELRSYTISGHVSLTQLTYKVIILG
jgi:hypothetical protein